MIDSIIQGQISTKYLYVGKGVHIEENVVISGRNGPANVVILGDYCYVGRETKIFVPEFRLGDYSKLNAFSFLNGDNPLRIGRNCWIGGNVVLDSMGGLDINDNVGIGTHSQIWTHIQFGDIIEGCRFFKKKKMTIGSDAWFVGHCIVSPVEVGQKSMALAGSVVTNDMLPNHIYAGVPAVDITSKMGYQFEDRTIEKKGELLRKYIDEYVSKNPAYKDQLVVVQSADEFIEGRTSFNVTDRTYTKNYSSAEINFMKCYVPLIKFIPHNEPSFIGPDYLSYIRNNKRPLQSSTHR